eukprot:GHVT01100479.1.p1 GENE.GHVT01100479.1~~GHVT01100479.1.p1  ORF type:complete len:112 (+),score=7.52 GHVT01100479.1:1150-1485(+)
MVSRWDVHRTACQLCEKFELLPSKYRRALMSCGRVTAASRPPTGPRCKVWAALAFKVHYYAETPARFVNGWAFVASPTDGIARRASPVTAACVPVPSGPLVTTKAPATLEN